VKHSIITLLLIICFFLKLNIVEAGVYNYSTAKSIDCQLPQSIELTIGCTSKCQRLNKRALKKYAKKLGYKITLKNLDTSARPIDFSGIDAIIVQAGPDINPTYYTSFVEAELAEHIQNIAHYAKLKKKGAKRDVFESALLDAYFKSTTTSVQITPILGIGRGMQMLAVSQEIPLYLDFKKEIGVKNRKGKLDKISIIKSESIISGMSKKDTFRGVKTHHQGLRYSYLKENISRFTHLTVSAESNDGKVAEVLEFFDNPVLGVQFRPDLAFGKVRQGLYKWVLNRACHKKRFELL